MLNAIGIDAGPSQTGDFDKDLAISGWAHLAPAQLDIFQINVGKLCNMTCRHCHVDSGPDRTEENMERRPWTTVSGPLTVGAHTVDLTGGAPELNPHSGTSWMSASGVESMSSTGAT